MPAEVIPLPSKDSKFFPDGDEWGAGIDPMPILDEEVSYRDLPPFATGEEVLQKEIAAWTKESALTNWGAPEVIIERSPVALIQLLLWFVRSRRP